MSDSLPGTRQAALSRGFSRQEYWSRLPFSSPWDLPNPGIFPLLDWQVGSLQLAQPGKPRALQEQDEFSRNRFYQITFFHSVAALLKLPAKEITKTQVSQFEQIFLDNDSINFLQKYTDIQTIQQNSLIISHIFRKIQLKNDD